MLKPGRVSVSVVYVLPFSYVFVLKLRESLLKLLNPFAPEPPITAPLRIQVLSILCDIVSFNGQGQLSSLTCAEWRNLSNHTRMSTIQSRTPERQAKDDVTLTWKSPRKSCSITHLHFLSPNTKMLKAFLKPRPTKMKPTKCPAR